MDENTADRIMQLAARLVILRDSTTVTNGEYLRLLVETLKNCFEIGKQYGKDK